MAAAAGGGRSGALGFKPTEGGRDWGMAGGLEPFKRPRAGPRRPINALRGILAVPSLPNLDAPSFPGLD